MPRGKKKHELCPRCGEPTEKTYMCPECGEWCCVEVCIGGIGVKCFQCEEVEHADEPDEAAGGSGLGGTEVGDAE